MLKRLSVLLLSCLGCLSPAAFAAQDPLTVVNTATNEVLAASEAAKSYYDTDPERYYGALETVLDRSIDFHRFARGVMGVHANEQRLGSEAEKAALRAEVDRFAVSIRRSLMVTYAKAVVLFSGEKITAKQQPAAANARSVTVEQLIQKGSDTHVVHYSLRQDGDAWKIFNVTVNGINMGTMYRNRFAEAVEQERGNVSAVIDRWQSILEGKPAS